MPHKMRLNISISLHAIKLGSWVHLESKSTILLVNFDLIFFLSDAHAPLNP